MQKMQNKNNIKIISIAQNKQPIYRPAFWNTRKKLILLRNPSPNNNY